MSEMELADTITEAPAEPAEVEAGAVEATGSAAPDQEAASAAETVEAPAAPTWTPDDPAFRDAVSAEAGAVAEARAEARFAELLEELAAAQGDPDPAATAAEQVAEFDFFADDAGSQLKNLLASERQQTLDAMKLMMSEITVPMRAQRQAEIDRANEEAMKDVLADIESREGELAAKSVEGLDSGEIIRTLAREVFLPQTAQRYGNSDRAAEQALEQAYKTMRQIEQAAEKRGYTRAESEFGGLAGAHREPAAAGSGSVVALGVGGNELDFAEQYVNAKGY